MPFIVAAKSHTHAQLLVVAPEHEQTGCGILLTSCEFSQWQTGRSTASRPRVALWWTVICAGSEYGSFYGTVRLPDGVKLETSRRPFADGVLEVSVPLPARPEASVRKVQIEEPKKTAKSAA